MGGAGAVGPLRWWELVARALAPAPTAIAVCVVALSAYHAVAYRPPVRIATVDLEGVVEALELQFADLVSRPGATDADREKALALAESAAPQMSRAVSELVSECGCLVLVKNAVVGQAGMDLTQRLKERMNVANVDVKAIRARLAGGKPDGASKR